MVQFLGDCPKYAIINPHNRKELVNICQKMTKNSQRMSNFSIQTIQRKTWSNLLIVLMSLNAGFTFKLLLLVSKLTGHKVLRFRNNLQVCVFGWKGKEWYNCDRNLPLSRLFREISFIYALSFCREFIGGHQLTYKSVTS